MHIRRAISLARQTRYRIGGKARYFVEAKTVVDVTAAVNWALENDIPFFFLGAGTNVLFSDRGFDGLVIKNNCGSIRRRPEGIFIHSGVAMSDAVDYFIRNKLRGLEWAGGLPGTVGGAVFGNAGCFGGEMKNAVVAVESLIVDHHKKRVIKYARTHRECGFGYRTSVFKQNGNEIITGVLLRGIPGDAKLLAQKAQSCIDYRKRFQPIEYPSAGSTFKNILLAEVSPKVFALFSDVIKNDPFPIIPVAAVLDRLGLKGARIGGVEISAKHPNFFINTNNGTANEVAQLIAFAQRKAKKKYGVVLEPEIRVIP